MNNRSKPCLYQAACDFDAIACHVMQENGVQQVAGVRRYPQPGRRLDRCVIGLDAIGWDDDPHTGKLA